MPRGQTLIVTLAGALLAACAQAPVITPVDRVFTGGPVFTVNPEQPWAEAVAVDDGRIVYVGDTGGVEALIGPETEVTDISGRMLMPGFIDSHMHPMAAGTRFLRCNLENLGWPDEVEAKVRQCAKTVKPGRWLRGVNLDTALFESGELHKSLLDEWVPDVPVFINSFLGNLAWVSSTVLDIAEIDRNTPDPPKGVIDRDPASGDPTGVLRNEAVYEPYQLIPVPDSDDLRLSLRLASEKANALGITTSNEASMRPELYEPFLAAEAAGEMTLRVAGSQSWDYNRGPEQVETLVERRNRAVGGMFTAGSVKLFLDGSMNTTGALLEPYEGTADDYGTLVFETARLNEVVRRLDAEGMQVHMHAYYDAAVRQGLDAIEYAMGVSPEWDRRHFLAHLALIHPDDLPRFAQLGVSANISALWAYLDEEGSEEFSALGEKRAQRLLAFNSLFESGALVTAGSDWISESMSPLYSIQVALTRRPPDGSGPAWNPDERVSLEQMLAAYTINGAWLMGLEDETGSIEVGKAADLIVLERNLFDTDPLELKDVKVLLTLLEGQVIYP